MSGAIVPQLRFPEFNGSWNPTSMGEALERVSEAVTVDPSDTYREIGVRSHGRGVFHKDPILGDELGNKRVFEVVPDALVLNIVFAWEQAVAMTSKGEAGFIASHRFPMFHAKDKKAYLPFILRFLLTGRGKELLELASPGGAGRNKTLGQQEFLKLKALMPEPAEQQKIADFLGTVDAKLDALRRKKSGLEAFKSGLMQRLFSQELRFTRDDGTEFPEWEEMTLGQIFTVCYGKDHKALDDGAIPVYGTGGIMRYVDRELWHGPSILIGRKGTIDRPMLVDGPFWTVDTLFYTRLNEGFNPRLVFALVEQVEWSALNEATGVPSLTSKAISSVRTFLPTDPIEQRKIADALSAMDAKIASVANQITYMETFKNGLLQQMFV